jgi:iron complex outermembrane receptor protein
MHSLLRFETTTDLRNETTRPRLFLGLLVLLSACSFAAGQSAAPASTAVSPNGAQPDETVELNAFQVKGTQPNRYQASEATSGGRLATDLATSPQTITVVTNELLKDVDAKRVYDGLKYFAGVAESTIPNGLDRLQIRGFQTDGRTVDGFKSQLALGGNLDPALVDRIEVVMGPSAILSPTGSPGGTVNVVSKKPLFRTQGSISVEAGLWDAGGVVIDSTAPLSEKVAYRIVGAFRNYDQYYDNAGSRSFSLLPSLTYVIKPGTELTVMGQIERSKVTNYLGLPIDPSAGTYTTARLLSGISRTLGLYDKDNIVRKDWNNQFRAFLTSKLTDHLSARVGLNYQNTTSYTTQLTISGTTGGGVNPLTGAYTPGIVYGPGPTYTPSPAPAASRTFSYGGSNGTTYLEQYDFQNDWAYKREFAGVKSSTAAGYAYVAENPVAGLTNNQGPITSAAINIDQPVLTPFTSTGPNNFVQTITLRQHQFYAQESLSAFADKLNVAAGLSRIKVNRTTLNLLTNAPTIIDAQTTSKNYGVVFTPIPAASVYYGYSENASPVASTTAPAGTPAFSEGIQHEYGVRVHAFEKRLQLGWVYFDIAQTGVSIANPGNLAVPPPSPPLNPLLTDNTSKGWETNFSYDVGHGLTLLGSYTKFKNRNFYHQPVRGTADETGALLARYDFSAWVTKGLSMTLGANYLGKRPGDSPFGLTAASTPTNLIPVLPAFYLPARTLVDWSLNYTTKSWAFQANVDNLLNKDYLLASLSRFSVYPGPKTNLRASATYKF